MKKTLFDKYKLFIIILLLLFISCTLPINKYIKICYTFNMVKEKDKLECNSGRRSLLCINPIKNLINDFFLKLIKWISLKIYLN